MNDDTLTELQGWWRETCFVTNSSKLGQEVSSAAGFESLVSEGLSLMGYTRELFLKMNLNHFTDCSVTDADFAY